MLLDLRKANAHVRITDKYLVKEVAHCARDQLVEYRLALVHILVDLLRALALERRLATDDLDHENTEAPDVSLVAVPVCISQHLRSDVGGRAAVGVRLLFDVLEPLGKAKVDQLKVASLRHRYYNVLWLEVTVDDAIIVQVLQCHEHLGSVVRHVSHDFLVVGANLRQKCATFDVF